MTRHITAGIRIVIIFAFLQILNYIANDTHSLWPDPGHLYLYHSFLIATALSILFLGTLLILGLVWWKAGSIGAFLAGSVNNKQYF
jgi:hypothetical protein